MGLFCCKILYLMNFTTKEELKTSLDKICKKHLQTLVVTRTVFVTSVYGHCCLMVPLLIQVQT